MPTPNDGGPAFLWRVPTFDTTRRQIEHSSENPGMSLRAWLASQETLSDFDQPDASPSNELCEGLAGPKPEGGWNASNILEMTAWEAKWRAALKVMRADAVLAALQEQPK